MAKLINDNILTELLIKNTPYETQAKIDELKSKLDETDYKAIKFAEGEITASEYEPIKLQRRIWRAQINELERSI